MLLPLVADPFTAPTDRDLVPSERREFVRTRRTYVFAYRRRSGGPAMSVVYYLPTDDELLVSTMAGRSIAIAAARDLKVSFCVLDERLPFTYLQAYADATVDPDPELVFGVMMAVGERMSGQPLGAEARPAVEAMAEQEGRVVLRCRPYATFATPPQRLHRSGEAARFPHWVPGSGPWDAPDPHEFQAAPAATDNAASTGRAGSMRPKPGALFVASARPRRRARAAPRHARQSSLLSCRVRPIHCPIYSVRIMRLGAVGADRT